MGVLTMTRTEREAFLAQAHVGVLCVPSDGAPVCSPIWYDYEPGGDIHVILDPRSRKGRLLKDGVSVTFVVQEESQPYKYVTVEGTVSLSAPKTEEHLRPLARRYLGDDLGDSYTDANPVEGAYRVSISPTRWMTADFAKSQAWANPETK